MIPPRPNLRRPDPQLTKARAFICTHLIPSRPNLGGRSLVSPKALAFTGMTALDGYTSEQLTFESRTKTVYRKGTGPAVIVMSEIPGITPAVIRFADAVVAAGFTVLMPHLFGEDGHEHTQKQVAKVSLQVCISREFTMFATGKSSPIVSWLRKLANHAHSECGGPGVGAIGMCMTGGFALGMLVENAVIAPVMSQPSIPVALGPLRKSRAEHIDVSEADLRIITQRLAAEPDLCVKAYRFTQDPLVPEDRFTYLEKLLGTGRFIGRSFDSSAKTDHSVLTESLQQAALDEVLDFFRKRLAPTASN